MVLIRAPRRCRPRFQQAMASLGLLAMLALVLLPTSGRLAGQAPAGVAAAALPATESFGHGHGHGAVGGHAMAHGGGASTGPATPEQAPGAPERSPHEGHADCAYCPLLASVLPAGVLPPRPAVVRHADRWDPPYRSARLGYLHPCGLGSRGPPIS